MLQRTLTLVNSQMRPSRFRLGEILDSATISQRELARRSGVGLVTINRIVGNHTQGITLATLDRLAAALGVSVCDLIDEATKRRTK